MKLKGNRNNQTKESNKDNREISGIRKKRTSCKICSNPKLRDIVNKLREAGYTYKQIQETLDKVGIHVSLGLLSKHFWHMQLENLDKIPEIEQNERILPIEITNKIVDEISYQLFKDYSPKELSEILYRLKELKEENKIVDKLFYTPRILYQELKQIVEYAVPEKLEKFRDIYLAELKKHGYTLDMKNKDIKQ